MLPERYTRRSTVAIAVINGEPSKRAEDWPGDVRPKQSFVLGIDRDLESFFDSGAEQFVVCGLQLSDQRVVTSRSIIGNLDGELSLYCHDQHGSFDAVEVDVDVATVAATVAVAVAVVVVVVVVVTVAVISVH